MSLTHLLLVAPAFLVAAAGLLAGLVFLFRLSLPRVQRAGSVTLILPLTGHAPGLGGLLRALEAQTLPARRLLVCVEDARDPACARAAQLASGARLPIEIVIAGQATRYDAGLWYNSAKFLDLEYQTYGLVHAQPQAGETHGWWEHASGRLGLRVVAMDGAVTGFNAMGLRLRHRTCERWILERRSPGYVLEHLAEAGFDPEFTRRYEPEVVATLAAQLGVEATV